MDRKEVDGEHDDDGDQHLGHFATGPELIVQGPVGRVQPEIRLNYIFIKKFNNIIGRQRSQKNAIKGLNKSRLGQGFFSFHPLGNVSII